MIEERCNEEPETAEHRELILLLLREGLAGVRILPLIGTETSNQKESNGDNDVGRYHVSPHLKKRMMKMGSLLKLSKNY